MSENGASPSKASYWSYWGKADAESFHPLVCHCLDVAAVGRVLFNHDKALELRFVRFLGAGATEALVSLLPFHDLGKFHPTFQTLRPDLVDRLGRTNTARAYDVRHDARGEEFWRGGLFRELEQNGLIRVRAAEGLNARKSLDVLMAPLFGHHGQPARTEQYGIPRPPRAELKDACAFANDWLAIRGPVRLSLEDQHAARYASWLTAGWAVLNDWIASNSAWFPYDPSADSLVSYWHKACERAEAAVLEAGILPKQFRSRASVSTLFPFLENATLSPSQTFADAFDPPREPSLLVLEDMTGSGKTEAALTLAQRYLAEGLADGVYVALPTMATANAMHDRVVAVARQLFEEPNDADGGLVLAHSATYLKSVLDHERHGDDDYDASERSVSQLARSWLHDSRKKALLAPLGVGTVDQALLASLPAKHGTLRLFGLHRKLLIVDEVHAYDSYTAELLVSLLRFHRALGGHAILLSATLPMRLKAKLASVYQPIETNDVADDFPSVLLAHSEAIHQYAPGHRPGTERAQTVTFVHDTSAVIERLASAARSHRCACWIRNTVSDAIEAAGWLAERGITPKLFHARFMLGHRLAIESEVLSLAGKRSRSDTRGGVVVVSTQVIEQSVDVDFDELVTDIAPIDLLIQRAGRHRRHSRDQHGNPADHDQRGPGEVVVLAPEWSEDPPAPWLRGPLAKTRFVYPNLGELWRSQQVLQAHGELRLPEKARELVEHVYGPDALDGLPPALQGSVERALGQGIADRGLALFNVLEPDDGYAVDKGQWLPDTVTPTRLGQPSTTLRLVDSEDGTPLYPHPRIGWSLSEVRARGVLANRPDDFERVKAFVATMPDESRYSVTLPMRRSSSGSWSGRAVDDKGQTVHFNYSESIGLQAEQE